MKKEKVAKDIDVQQENVAADIAQEEAVQVDAIVAESAEEVVQEEESSDLELETEEAADEIVDIAAPSIEENEALMTETLANIHIKQKHYHKAITIFEKLSLKYPEKSIYFAARIKEMERLITNL